MAADPGEERYTDVFALNCHVPAYSKLAAANQWDDNFKCLWCGGLLRWWVNSWWTVVGVVGCGGGGLRGCVSEPLPASRVHEIANLTAMRPTDLQKTDYETTLAKIHEKVQMSNAEAEAIKSSMKMFLRY